MDCSRSKQQCCQELSRKFVTSGMLHIFRVCISSRNSHLHKNLFISFLYLFIPASATILEKAPFRCNKLCGVSYSRILPASRTSTLQHKSIKITGGKKQTNTKPYFPVLLQIPTNQKSYLEDLSLLSKTSYTHINKAFWKWNVCSAGKNSAVCPFVLEN